MPRLPSRRAALAGLALAPSVAAAAPKIARRPMIIDAMGSFYDDATRWPLGVDAPPSPKLLAEIRASGVAFHGLCARLPCISGEAKKAAHEGAAINRRS